MSAIPVKADISLAPIVNLFALGSDKLKLFCS